MRNEIKLRKNHRSNTFRWFCYALQPSGLCQFVLFGPAHEAAHHILHGHAMIKDLIDTAAKGHFHTLPLRELVDAFCGVIALCLLYTSDAADD